MGYGEIGEKGEEREGRGEKGEGRGEKGEGRGEKGEACDQEVEAVKICTGLGLCKHRIRAICQGHSAT